MNFYKLRCLKLASSRIPQLPKAEDIQFIPLSIFYFALIALGILIIYGIIGSLYIMKLDFINSIYFTRGPRSRDRFFYKDGLEFDPFGCAYLRTSGGVCIAPFRIPLSQIQYLIC